MTKKEMTVKGHQYDYEELVDTLPVAIANRLIKKVNILLNEYKHIKKQEELKRLPTKTEMRRGL